MSTSAIPTSAPTTSGPTTTELINTAFNVLIAIIGLTTLVFSFLSRKNAVAAHKVIRVARDELGRVHNLVLTMVLCGAFPS
jgi:hypothetical protein